MTLTQLTYILAVDRCRNFGEAARECFVTQPTLSMQIQKLEDYLQIIIFDRSKNPTVPTPMGKKVIEHAKAVMQESLALEGLAKSIRGEVSGEYVLGIIPTLAPYLLPLFIQDFNQRYPKVELKIYEYQTTEITQYLKEGKIDGAILATPLEEKDLVEEHLFHEPFQVFLSPKHPNLKKKFLEHKDLNLAEAWLLKEGHCLRLQALQLCQNQKVLGSKQIFFEAGSLETLINLVKNSNGFTVLPFLASQNLSKIDQDMLRDFKGEIPVREISFVTGPLSIKESIDKALIETVQANIPNELKKNRKKSVVLAIQ